ncbi:hypothetical protein ACFYMO_00800 [Streptomyces sp. NPDC007025]|uniref:hypothetical protein n=1 Tax=Streptomyces sp. NPDC007025 TaxID=3364771 RepID=UPI0036C4849A
MPDGPAGKGFTMKVRITLTLDIDPEAWSLAYGTTTEAAAVREDVRSYVLNSVQGAPAVEEGGITDVRMA